MKKLNKNIKLKSKSLSFHIFLTSLVFKTKFKRMKISQNQECKRKLIKILKMQIII